MERLLAIQRRLGIYTLVHLFLLFFARVGGAWLSIAIFYFRSHSDVYSPNQTSTTKTTIPVCDASEDLVSGGQMITD